MLTIGIPLVGDLPQECVTDLIVAAAQAGKLSERISVICPQNIFPHDRARELIMTEALKMGSDYLWFIDADTRPPEGALEKMLAVLHETKCAMVSGYYVQRGYPFVSTWSKVRKDKVQDGMVVIEETEVAPKIDSCGLGCALIGLKWVRENLVPPYFLMHPDPDLPTMFRWEDAFFCNKIKEAGGAIYGTTEVCCIHMGRRGELTPETAGRLREHIDRGQRNG